MGAYRCDHDSDRHHLIPVDAVWPAWGPWSHVGSCEPKYLEKETKNLTKTGARKRELVSFDESSPGHPGWEVKACAKAWRLPVSFSNFKEFFREVYLKGTGKGCHHFLIFMADITNQSQSSFSCSVECPFGRQGRAQMGIRCVLTLETWVTPPLANQPNCYLWIYSSLNPLLLPSSSILRPPKRAAVHRIILTIPQIASSLIKPMKDQPSSEDLLCAIQNQPPTALTLHRGSGKKKKLRVALREG